MDASPLLPLFCGRRLFPPPWSNTALFPPPKLFSASRNSTSTVAEFPFIESHLSFVRKKQFII